MNKLKKHTADSKSTDLDNVQIEHFDSFYFLGIGGIGMSALARYFSSIGKTVTGYDKTASPLTDKLQEEGISIDFKDNIELIKNSGIDKTNTLVVYTPAVPDDHPRFQYFKNHGFSILKRAEVLGKVTQDTFCFAVAGTHGKTTTSTILAHLLYECGYKITAFLGGISLNHNSNFVKSGNEITVVEADEYDRSFLKLSPNFACITSMDADHLDIYGESEKLQESFSQFAARIKSGGKLFVKNGLPLEGITYGLEEDADYAASEIKIIDGEYHFNLITPNETYNDFKFNLPGRHNLSNAIIALAMSVEYGCPPNQLANALASFTGVNRRFNYHIKEENLVFIDDYAHHPEEIKAVFNAVCEMYPDRKKLVVFQPHLFSRTKDFAEDFAKELSKFDSIMLLDIYPAREKPITGITSEWLLEKIENENKRIVSKENLVDVIKNENIQLLITLGAGDIGEEVSKIKAGLEG